MPRNELTIFKKFDLLDKISKQLPSTCHRQLAKITGVSKSTISNLIKRENQIRHEWAFREGNGKMSKRKQEGKDPAVEEALDKWFS